MVAQRLAVAHVTIAHAAIEGNTGIGNGCPVGIRHQTGILDAAYVGIGRVDDILAGRIGQALYIAVIDQTVYALDAVIDKPVGACEGIGEFRIVTAELQVYSVAFLSVQVGVALRYGIGDAVIEIGIQIPYTGAVDAHLVA